jgi:hypothetical protein
MGDILEVNGQPAIKIIATEVKRTNRAVCLDCEGDVIWFPISTVKVEKETVLIQEWKYKQVFES